jgi:hypothetical protein
MLANIICDSDIDPRVFSDGDETEAYLDYSTWAAVQKAREESNESAHEFLWG